MINKTKILFAGLGNMSSIVLDMLMRQADSFDFVVAGRNLKRIAERANLSKLVGAQFGNYHRLEIEELELNSIDQVACVMDKHRPDIVFNGASLQSWWVINELPSETLQILQKARFGPWLPMHLALTEKLMRGVQESKVKAFVVNAAFPDAVNPILWRHGIGPDLGIGNVANVIAGLQAAVADYLLVPPARISVRFFTHHFLSHHLSRYGETGSAPYHFSAYLDGEEVTSSLNLPAVFKLVSTKFKRSGGLEGAPMTASSAVKALQAVIAEDGRIFHAPGPNGMPGGYAVQILEGRQLKIALPSGLSVDQAIDINNRCQVFDGIEKIDSDGTIYFAEREMEIMNKTLGYYHRSMKLEDCEGMALELAQRYKVLLTSSRSNTLVPA